MITVTTVEVRAGAAILLEEATFRVGAGDKVGLVGRNGAGKTTLTKILAGEAQPASGTVTRSGAVGYLPQDPRTGDLDVMARDRILSARGLDSVLHDLATAQQQMASADLDTHERGMRRYGRLETEFLAKGGYAAESEAASIAASLGLPDRVLGQPLRTLSGGQRRRVELARILFSDAQTLLLDEPTNHLDADSITWLRDFLRSYKGGLVVISHDVELLDATVNRVFHLDANRAALDLYNVGWKAYLTQRETDERRRRARAGQRREEGVGTQGPGRPHALQGHQGDGRAKHGQARRPASRRARLRASLRPCREDSLPRSGAERQDAAHRT